MVIPNKGAMVVAHFDAHVGARVLITLIRTGGKPVPFGAVVVSDDQSLTNIVDDGGIVYLSGIKPGESVNFLAQWGTAASQQCKATVQLEASRKSVQSLTTQCR
ncbi:FimD/PapC C-terminal domain-containing protein [Rahnella aceris]|uniref:FimD/PapC C-terminal domain-containing protein n=1 Tax=Rahnella sp. (strain Y9602) TaxID=2703885 RepID=UPI00345F24DC